MSRDCLREGQARGIFFVLKGVVGYHLYIRSCSNRVRLMQFRLVKLISIECYAKRSKQTPFLLFPRPFSAPFCTLNEMESYEKYRRKP